MLTISFVNLEGNVNLYIFNKMFKTIVWTSCMISTFIFNFIEMTTI
jgi:hypothetical protein